ncbi:MAG: polyprenyl synthetase family protein [Planctomycetaceae bacterium]|jgi:octaprenyl-diphosphate synthase|nr:polyprenyl synthetase family protein [Planctomycetaceae bacterium]
MPSQLSVNTPLPESLLSIYHIIETEIKEMNAILLKLLSDNIPFVHEVVHYAFQLGGKRLRPAITLLCFKAARGVTSSTSVTCKNVPQQVLMIAAALEMIHTATLIHDDILDGALIRRHIQTMHLRWDAGISVMAGDMIFMKALDVVSQLEEPAAYRILAKACHATCYGELRQMSTRNRFDISVSDYLEIISGKTAALIECGSQLGAYYAKAEQKTVEEFHQFGHEIGIAFQIVDDILDVVGDEKKMGKTLGTDVAQQKPTLPLLLFFESLTKSERAKITEECAEQHQNEHYVQNLITQIAQSGAIDTAMTHANHLVDSAINRIRRLAETFPLNSESQQATAALCELAAFVVNRKK